MKFGILSDIHGYPPLEEDCKELATCDVVCLCGDVFEGTHLEDFANKQIIDWMKSLTDAGKRVIMTPGNHDIMMYRGWLEKNNLPIDNYCRHIWRARPLMAEDLKRMCGCEVLIDEGTEVNKIKIYSTPWCPLFYNWSFMKDENDLHKIFSKIPDNTNIILTHTPPNNEKSEIDVSDYDRSRHCGSKSLASILKNFHNNQINLFCGHIHSGDHKQKTKIGNVFCTNVSYVNENYKPYYKPYYFKIEAKM